MSKTDRIGLAGAFAAALLVTGAAFGDVTDEQQQRIREAMPDEPRVEPQEARRVLIWSRPAGFVHSSIPHGAFAMKAMAEKTGAFEAVETTDLAMFLPENLEQFDAVILNNTTGPWITPTDEDMENLAEEGEDKDAVEARLRQSLLDFVSNGGGLVGYHSSSDANYHWPEFGEMIGGWFHHHPWHERVRVHVEEPDHPLSRAFDGDFDIVDEIYQFRDPYSRDNLRVLLSLDTEHTDMDKGNIERADGDFAVAWTRTWGEGRVFYSSLGHREEIFWNPTIMEFYRDGIQYALGDLDADATPSSAASTGN